MMHVRMPLALLAAWLVICAPAAIAEEAEDLDATVRKLTRALSQGNYAAVTETLNRSIELYPALGDEKFEPLLRLIAKGVSHRDTSIATESVRTLGKIRYPGSSRYLNRLLNVPRKVSQERWNLYLVAIKTAGVLHEPGSVSDLNKLIGHDRSEFAVAAAKALAEYSANKIDERIPVVHRLATTLGRLEKKRAKTTTQKVHLEVVKAALVDTIRKVSGDAKLKVANDARAWVREQERKLKEKREREREREEQASPSIR